MESWLERTELLLGREVLARLEKAHVMVAGLGGVGAYAAEQLCRAGIGELTIIDGDVVKPSNRNRQLIALTSTEGKSKAQVMRQRLQDINPAIRLHIVDAYLKEEQFASLLEGTFDYVLDAIDTLSPKVTLLAEAVKRGHRTVSSMGAGGRLQPEKIEIADLADSHHCKFAYMVRKYLHRLGVYSGITVVYSPEPVNRNAVVETTGEENRRSVVGTISYMPPVFGCYCASVVIRNLVRTT